MTDHNEPIPTDQADKAINLIGYHLAQLRKLRIEHHDISERFTTEIDRIKHLMDERLSVVENAIEWRTGLIQDAHKALYGRDMAGKTIHTPHGESKLKEPKTPQVHTVDGGRDVSGFLAWAEAHHPDIVKRSLTISDIRKVVEVVDGQVIDPKTGEILEGLIAQVPRPTVSVHPAEGEPV